MQATAPCHRYARLPIDSFVMSTGVDPPPTAAFNPGSSQVPRVDNFMVWDSAQICGCCGNGRGCWKGTSRIAYSTVCMPCAQAEAGAMVTKITDPQHSTLGMLAHAGAALLTSQTKSMCDDILWLHVTARQLQSSFRPEDRQGTCASILYSVFCSSCYITWILNTAENIEKAQAAQKARSGK